MMYPYPSYDGGVEKHILPRVYIENLMLKKNDLVFKSMRYDDDEPGIIMPIA